MIIYQIKGVYFEIKIFNNIFHFYINKLLLIWIILMLILSKRLDLLLLSLKISLLLWCLWWKLLILTKILLTTKRLYLILTYIFILISLDIRFSLISLISLILHEMIF